MNVVPPERTGQVVRDGGRRVGWAEWGPLDGSPVLFCTGAAMTSSLGFGAEVLSQLGVRLVCVDRAGLGRSDPDPHKSFASYTGDVAAVLDQLAIPRLPIVGFSQGAPFALALLACATRIALVAGQDELAHPRMRPMLRPEIAELVDQIAADPVSFEAAMHTRVDAEGMWELVMGMCAPHDRAIYGAEGFADAYRRTLDEGFAQGPAGYVRDLALALGPWPRPPEDIAVPVDLWYGLLDESPVHSPDAGATLATRFPQARLHQLAGEGSSLLWTRAEEILRSLWRDSH